MTPIHDPENLFTVISDRGIGKGFLLDNDTIVMTGPEPDPEDEKEPEQGTIDDEDLFDDEDFEDYEEDEDEEEYEDEEDEE